MNNADYQSLLVQCDGGVTTLTLNRPETMNAANFEMQRELCQFFIDAALDPDLRVIVMTGAGDVFSAGGDFDDMENMIADPSLFWDELPFGKQLISAILDCNKPIIAKINGHAMGLGATLALFCDVTFAAETARIGDPHVAIGFVAGDGGAVIWPQLAGINRAKEYLFTGEAIPATVAAEIGLINHAVPADELDARVDDYVAKVAAAAPRAVQWTKASMNIGLKQLASSTIDASLAYEALSNSTRDHQEALSAFREKRKPSFEGK